MSWDIFRGGQDVWRRSEMAERFTEATMRHARLQRDALESIDKAWTARTVTPTRIAALTRQLEAARKTIAAFQKEYELGQRSLIDLLNAQNQYFNASVSLTSARGVMVFADYQLLAAMGTLLEYLKAPPPVDAAPVDLLSFGLIRLWASDRSGESAADRIRTACASPRPAPAARRLCLAPSRSPRFKDRWPQSGSQHARRLRNGSHSKMAPGRPTVVYGDPTEAASFAEPGKPHWLLTAFSPTRNKLAMATNQSFDSRLIANGTATWSVFSTLTRRNASPD